MCNSSGSLLMVLDLGFRVALLIFFFWLLGCILCLAQGCCKCNLGLKSDAIKALPEVSHKSSGSLAVQDDDQCCICLERFEDGEIVKVLPPCNHFYHPRCVDKWLTAHATCPLCRASLRRFKPRSNDTLPTVV